MTKDEINKIIQANKGPQGVTAQGDNGKLYFLDSEQEKKLIIHPNNHQLQLRTQVLNKIALRSTTPQPEVSFCDGLEDWLVKHSIFTDGWGDIAQWYLNEC